MKRIWIEDARRKAGLTQAQLAERINRTQAYISKIESGTIAEPSATDIFAIAEVLGLDPQSLRYGRRQAVA